MKNIYLIKGESYYLINNKINEILKDINDIEKYDLNEVELKDIIDNISYISLFDDKKGYIISNTKYFSDKGLYSEESEEIYNSLSILDDNKYVIFICNNIDEKKDLVIKLLGIGATIIDLDKISDDDKELFIKEYISNNNIDIDNNAITYLLDNTDNIDIFISELNRLSLLKTHIDTNIIENNSAYINKDVTLDFSNAIIAKDYSKAFDLLELLLSDDVDISSLIGLLANNYKNLYLIKDMIDNGLNDYEIMDITKYKSGRIYIIKKNLKLYTKDEIIDLINNLAIVDLKIKTGSNPVYVFKEFLLNI